jgi:group I intron endonuclease
MTARKTTPKSAIYTITNTVNGHFYVGSAKDYMHRWRVHRNDWKSGRHPNPHLLHAVRAYGEDAFEFKVIEYIEDIKDLIVREQYWMDTLHPEYNIAPLAYSRLGTKHRPESLRKMHEKQSTRTKEPHQGIPHTEETKAMIKTIKLAQAQPATEEQKRCLALGALANTGKQRDPDVVAKITHTKWVENRDETLAGLRRGQRQRREREKEMDANGIPYIKDETRLKWSVATKRRWERYRAAKEAAKQVIQHPLFPDETAQA